MSDLLPHTSVPYSGSLIVGFYNGAPLTETFALSLHDALPIFSSPKKSCTTTVPTSPCINVTKTCPATVPFGTTSISFSGVVTNCGDVRLAELTAEDH